MKNCENCAHFYVCAAQKNAQECPDYSDQTTALNIDDIVYVIELEYSGEYVIYEREIEKIFIDRDGAIYTVLDRYGSEWFFDDTYFNESVFLTYESARMKLDTLNE